jgi:hypothetical protein
MSCLSWRRATSEVTTPGTRSSPRMATRGAGDGRRCRQHAAAPRASSPTGRRQSVRRAAGGTEIKMARWGMPCPPQYAIPASAGISTSATAPQ